LSHRNQTTRRTRVTQATLFTQATLLTQVTLLTPVTQVTHELKQLQIMKINRFEDIQVWQEARKLVKMVYDLINKNQRFSKDLRLASQIQAAAVSSMSNIAEGFSRKGNKEFVQFLFISKSSTAEVQSQLYVALDQDYISQSDFTAVYEQADIVSKMVSSFIKYLNSQLK
jgi:four helix bundle protein